MYLSNSFNFRKLELRRIITLFIESILVVASNDYILGAYMNKRTLVDSVIMRSFTKFSYKFEDLMQNFHIFSNSNHDNLTCVGP